MENVWPLKCKLGLTIMYLCLEYDYELKKCRSLYYVSTRTSLSIYQATCQTDKASTYVCTNSYMQEYVEYNVHFNIGKKNHKLQGNYSALHVEVFKRLA